MIRADIARLPVTQQAGAKMRHAAAVALSKGLTMDKFTYDMHPTLRVDDGFEKCSESEADQWSVYERPVVPDENGFFLAVWVADFARKEDAIAFMQLFEGADNDL